MKKENHNVVISVPFVGKAVVGQALPDNAPAKGHLAAFAARAVIPLLSLRSVSVRNIAGYSGRFAFTLIELLVVVLIIGILAAVAVPQYQKTIERSKATEALTMLSSIAKAYQTHYLANGQYAEKFDELDVDVPFTGNTVAMIINENNGDTKSNKDWSFQIQEDSTLSGYTTLFATRIDGKYKGAGFGITFENPSHTAGKELRCFERISASNFLFDTDLPAGAYCERVMQGVFSSENKWSRYYRLP